MKPKSKYANNKLTDAQRAEIRQARENGVPLKHLAKKFNVTMSAISLTCKH